MVWTFVPRLCVENGKREKKTLRTIKTDRLGVFFSILLFKIFGFLLKNAKHISIFLFTMATNKNLFLHLIWTSFSCCSIYSIFRPSPSLLLLVSLSLSLFPPILRPVTHDTRINAAHSFTATNNLGLTLVSRAAPPPPGPAAAAATARLQRRS